MRPRCKDKETRISEIQHAAREVFFKKGFLSASIEDVAKKAGIAKGTIYLYFQNKDDLYMSLMEQFTGDLVKRLLKFEKELDETDSYGCCEVFMGFMKLFLEWRESDIDSFNVTTTVHQGGYFNRMSPETLERINTIGRKGFKVMRDIFRKAKEKGTIKKDLNEALLVDMIYATFLGIAQHEQNKKLVTQKDHLLETLEKAFLGCAMACVQHS
jgi:AcrR family transcriptional regulator